MPETCDWCGNEGHALDAHPLSKDHPHFDPDLDENPLMDLALRDFLDFQRNAVEPVVVEAPKTPIQAMLGTGPAACTAYVHWWPTTGSWLHCLCGQKVREENHDARP